MVLSTAYFGVGQNDWKQPTGLWWHTIKLTFEIDYGMLSAILLYVTVLKSTNDHFSYIRIGLKKVSPVCERWQNWKVDVFRVSMWCFIGKYQFVNNVVVSDCVVSGMYVYVPWMQIKIDDNK